MTSVVQRAIAYLLATLGSAKLALAPEPALVLPAWSEQPPAPALSMHVAQVVWPDIVESLIP